MRLTIICIGKTKEGFIRDGIAKYARYLKPYAAVELKELKEEKINDLKEAPLVRKKEAEKIFNVLSKGSWIIALDERGQGFTSHAFASLLNKTMESSMRELTFIVGGAMGLDESVLQRANMVLAISRWTLTHEMALLVLLEQLYRGYTIIKGKRYHY